MERKNLVLSGLFLLSATSNAIYAATPINLHHSLSVVPTFISTSKNMPNNLVETSRAFDAKQTLHVRVQQTYLGYPVFGADAVIHVPKAANNTKSLADVLNAAETNNGSANGILYQALQQDLAKTPAIVFQPSQAAKALKHAISLYQANDKSIQNEKTQLIVFIDGNNKAHWAFQTQFYVPAAKSGDMPAKPVYLLDAQTFQVYAQWDDVKTQEAEADGGGFGGNPVQGKLVYDGLSSHLPTFAITRDDLGQCYLKNAQVTVRNYRINPNPVIGFACNEADPEHNNVFWDGDLDAANEGYSPGNDALFAGNVIKNMYNEWYNVPALVNPDGSPMMLTMVVHDPIDNAFWDGEKMTFGDGVSAFYPLTSIGVASHEVSHGFTEQHSGLAYFGQSGGINEAYSDMAAQAAEYFAYHNNTWMIGSEISKTGEPIRYMETPSKDCHGRKPGQYCSIDHASQYKPGLNVHYSSGVFNRLFYLLSTSAGWDTRKAFDIMVSANMNYWTKTATYQTAACGILYATEDLGFEKTAVVNAINTVGISIDQC